MGAGLESSYFSHGACFARRRLPIGHNDARWGNEQRKVGSAARGATLEGSPAHLAPSASAGQRLQGADESPPGVELAVADVFDAGNRDHECQISAAIVAA